MNHLPSSADLAASGELQELRPWITRRLLAWFNKHARPLPWRRNRDPYAIWISEVMLQQTQAAAVIPYFERFLQTFPTVVDLAHADEQDVLKLWEGLGYYRRARDLHRAAQVIVHEHDGVLPRELAELRSLPGFGRYTAGAVASQAHDIRAPIIEANSRRLWARFFGYRADLQSGPAERWLWQVAEALLPMRNSGQFNQAVMELGALVCTVKSPGCAQCPLSSRCTARQHNAQAEIPVLGRRKQITEVDEIAVVIRRGPEVLLVQRPAHGRWPKLWEFPHAVREAGEAAESAAIRVATALTGLTVARAAPLLTLKHSVTRFRITLTCLECVYQSGLFRSETHGEARWLLPAQLNELPISSPQRKLANWLVRAMCTNGAGGDI